MALRDIFFSRRSSDSSNEGASPLDKPTFAESFFGFGKAVKERDIQVKRIYKEYRAQKNDFLRSGQKQRNELEKSLTKHKERLFSEGGYKNLADVNRLTRDQLKDYNLKKVVDKFESDKKKELKKFERNQSEGLRSLQKDRDFKRHEVFERTHSPRRGMASDSGKTTLAA